MEFKYQECKGGWHKKSQNSMKKQSKENLVILINIKFKILKRLTLLVKLKKLMEMKIWVILLIQKKYKNWLNGKDKKRILLKEGRNQFLEKKKDIMITELKTLEKNDEK